MEKTISHAWKSVTDYIPLNKIGVCGPTSSPIVGVQDMVSPIVRLAGLSGAVAISLGAYGSHVMRDNEDISARRRGAFETASRYHLIHSVALLGSTNARYPKLTAGLFTVGILLFSGTCYHYSITGSEETRRFTPIGGVTLILAWLSFIL